MRLFTWQILCGVVGSVMVGAAVGGPLGLGIGSALFAVAAASAIALDAVRVAAGDDDDEL